MAVLLRAKPTLKMLYFAGTIVALRAEVEKSPSETVATSLL
jgi:hypothetical protein